MHHTFQARPDLQITPVEKIRLPLKSRDELPPILSALQWVWIHPALKAEIFALLEAKILAGKHATGRRGMDLWQILVLGVVRLGLDADWDRMEHVALLDETLLQQINARIAAAGREVFVKKGSAYGAGKREALYGIAAATQRGGEQDQQP